jgi:hypothetical protein
MKVMKTKPTTPTEPTTATRGTAHAAAIRSSANKLCDEQRESLRNRGMQLIYGGGQGDKVTANRR